MSRTQIGCIIIAVILSCTCLWAVEGSSRSFTEFLRSFPRRNKTTMPTMLPTTRAPQENQESLPTYNDTNRETLFLSSFTPTMPGEELRSYNQVLAAPKTPLPTPLNKAAKWYLAKLIRTIEKIESLVAQLSLRQKNRFFALINERINSIQLVAALKQVNSKKALRLAMYDPGFAQTRRTIISHITSMTPLLKQMKTAINSAAQEDTPLIITAGSPFQRAAKEIAQAYPVLLRDMQELLSLGTKKLDEVKQWRTQRIAQLQVQAQQKEFEALRMQQRADFQRRLGGQMRQPYLPPRQRAGSPYAGSNSQSYPSGSYVPYDDFGSYPDETSMPTPSEKPDDAREQKPPETKDSSKKDIGKDADKLRLYENKIKRFGEIVQSLKKSDSALAELKLDEAKKLSHEIETLEDGLNQTSNTYKKSHQKYLQAKDRYLQWYLRIRGIQEKDEQPPAPPITSNLPQKEQPPKLDSEMQKEQQPPIAPPQSIVQPTLAEPAEPATEQPKRTAVGRPLVELGDGMRAIGAQEIPEDETVSYAYRLLWNAWRFLYHIEDIFDQTDRKEMVKTHPTLSTSILESMPMVYKALQKQKDQSIFRRISARFREQARYTTMRLKSLTGTQSLPTPKKFATLSPYEQETVLQFLLEKKLLPLLKTD